MKNVLKVVIAITLISLGGRVEIPLMGVPFILSDFFVFLFALVLPIGVFSITLISFLTLGIMGLPLFAGGSGGLEYFLGNTGGYLFGYLAGGSLVSAVKGRLKSNISGLFLMFSGYYLLFIFGIAWLMISNSLSLAEALKTGFYPFVLSMHLKASLAWAVYYFLLRKIRSIKSFWID